MALHTRETSMDHKRLLRSMISGFVVLSLAACITYPGSTPTTPTPTPEVKPSPDGLVLEKADQAVLAGYYTHNGTAIRFNIESSPSLVMKLETMSGKPLIYFEYSPDGKLSNARVLGERAVFTSTLDTEGHMVFTYSGDPTLLDHLVVTSEELGLLPALSREIGEGHGITGKAYPISLPLHFMALGVARRHPNGDLPGPRITLTPCPDMENDPCAPSDCFGMCGKGCSCWEWVCGNCCCNVGCRSHDESCGSCSWENILACLNCYTTPALAVPLKCEPCSYEPNCPKPSKPNCGYDTCGSGEQCCGDFCFSDKRECP